MAKLVIGLDISGETWKAVVISSGPREKLRVEGYASFAAPPFPARELFALEHGEDGFDEVFREWSGSIRDALLPFLGHARSIVIGVPQDAVSLRVLELPFIQSSKIRTVLPYEVESSLPFDAEDLVFDFYPLRQLDGRTRVLSAAIDRDRVAAALDHLKLADLDPAVLAPTPLSFHHLIGISSLPEELLSARVLFLDVGIGSSYLSVVDGGQTVFSARLPVGGAEMTAGDGLGQDVAKRLAGLLTRQLHFLEGFSPLDSGFPPTLKKIVLMGEGAMAPGLAEYLAEALGVETERFRFPEQSMTAEAMVPVELQAELGPALALALQTGAAQQRAAINFRRQEFSYKPERRLLIRRAIMPGILVLVFFLSLFLNYQLSGSSGKGEVAAVNNEMAAGFKRVFPTRPAGDPTAQLAAILKEYKDKQKNYEALDYPSALRVISEVSNVIPKEISVTVNSFEYKGKDASIRGVASKLDETNEIEKRLATVPIFANVKLDKASSTKDGEWHFKIAFDLKKESGP